MTITMETQKSRDYSWRENLPNYGLCLTAERTESLCPGVTYLQRDYVRNDGKPVQTHIVIASKDAPATAAVWGSPQGQSQTVPEHVAQMESLGKDVIAAVNADFFHFFNNGDKTTYGAQIMDGVVYKEPNLVEHYGDNWFGVTNQGEYVLSDLAGYESTYKGNLYQAVGGGVWLMREHQLCPHRSEAVDPRTAVAITDDGGLVLVCVDGRSEATVGATYADLLQVFLDLDVPIRTALNLDGGHSTILMGKNQSGEMRILNSPSSGLAELRPVADILTLVKKEGGTDMNQKIRWGVIGAGGIADRRTIPGMMLCDNAELVAVMEINMELAEKCRAKWGCKKAYDNEADLLADPEIDAVYIASPVVLHAKQAMAAADAGKHILIEKPLAMTAEEGQKVVDYCESKGVKIAAGLMMRFGSYVQAMKKAIAEGKIGKPVSGYAQFTCWYPDIPGAWRQTKAASGGGAMMDMGVHCIDLMQYILDSNAKDVAAFHDTLSFHYEVEDSSTVLMRMENGCQCVVQSNFNVPDEAAKWRIEIFGDRGRLLGYGVIGQEDGGTLDAMFLGEQGGYVAQQDTNKAEGQTIEVEFGNAYAREIASFSNSLLTGAPLEVPACQAVQVQRIMEAAYKSNDEGKTIQL